MKKFIAALLIVVFALTATLTVSYGVKNGFNNISVKNVYEYAMDFITDDSVEVEQAEQIAALQTQLTTTQTQLTEANEALELSTADNTALQEDKSVLQAAILSLEGDVVTLQASIDALTADNSTQATTITALEADIFALQADITTLTTQVTDLQTQLTSYYNLTAADFVVDSVNLGTYYAADGLEATAPAQDLFITIDKIEEISEGTFRYDNTFNWGFSQNAFNYIQQAGDYYNAWSIIFNDSIMHYTSDFNEFLSFMPNTEDPELPLLGGFITSNQPGNSITQVDYIFELTNGVKVTMPINYDLTFLDSTTAVTQTNVLVSSGPTTYLESTSLYDELSFKFGLSIDSTTGNTYLDATYFVNGNPAAIFADSFNQPDPTLSSAYLQLAIDNQFAQSYSASSLGEGITVNVNGQNQIFYLYEDARNGFINIAAINTLPGDYNDFIYFTVGEYEIIVELSLTII